MALALLLLALGRPAGAAAQGAWFGEPSVIERRLGRLERATSASERAAGLDALGRFGGPPERLAQVLAALAAREVEPEPEAALLRAAARLALSHSDPAWRALAPPLAARWPGTVADERETLARSLAAVGGPEALAFLIERVEAEAVVRAALPWASDRAAVIAALGEAAARARRADLLPYADALDALTDAAAVPALVALLGRDEPVDRRVAEALIHAVGPQALAGPPARRGPAEAGRALALPALRTRLTEVESVSTRAALVEALGALGAGGEVPAGWAESEEPDLAAAALVARARAAPAEMLPALLAALDGPPSARAAVRRVLAEGNDPALVTVAEALLEREDGGPWRALALDLLGRAREGSGLDLLVRQGAWLPAALAARRAADHPAAARVRELLTERAPELAALAGARIEAGAGLSWAIAQALGPAPSTEALEAALDGAEAPAQAWLLEAARRHRLRLPAGWLRAALEADAAAAGLPEADPGHAAAALLRLVPQARGGTDADRRVLGRALSRGLIDPRAPVRAAAANAAAEDGRRERLGALGALLDDPHPAVRLAAARALVALAPEERAAVLGRAVVEGEPRLARLLRAMGRGEADTSADVLVVETIDHRAEGGTIWLDVRSDDGLWRRLPASPSGWFVLPDVPGPSAEVSLSL